MQEIFKFIQKNYYLFMQIGGYKNAVYYFNNILKKKSFKKMKLIILTIFLVLLADQIGLSYNCVSSRSTRKNIFCVFFLYKNKSNFFLNLFVRVW
jgi:hypothetical protein